MKSPAHASRSTRATRRTVTEDEPTTPATPRPEQEIISAGGAWNNDDSFSGEEHFISMRGGSPSWDESQSLGDEITSEQRKASARPSSGSHTRDRRKQFDATTPTLIDEPDDEEGDTGADGELCENVLDVSSDLQPSVGVLIGGSAMLRRTPGASQMHQSAASADETVLAFGGVGEVADGGIAPAAAAAAVEARQWPSLPETGRSETDGAARAQRPPLVPGERTEAPQGPFVFAPWAKPAADPRAFSPNILRLTEDIGNLLHEDEDDDYAIEIPSVFRGEPDQSAAGSGSHATDLGGDWTGSYVFDQQQSRGGSRRGGTVQRPGVVAKDGKPRRRQHHHHSNSQGSFSQQQPPPGEAQFSFFPVAEMQLRPTPRRGGHQLFEFGKQQHMDSGIGDHGQPILNFGGAFHAPPPQPKEVFSGQQPQNDFARPVASPLNEPFPPPYQQQHFSPPPQSEGPPVAFGMQSISFDSYRQQHQQQPHIVQPMPTHFGGSLPDFGAQDRSVVPPQQEPDYQAELQQQLSEMHATAQEFVPMSTRSSTPSRQFMASQQQPSQQQHPWQSPPPPMNFEQPPTPVLDLGLYPGVAPTNSFQLSPAASYCIPAGFASETARSATTPSPHIQTWQQPTHSDTVVLGRGNSAVTPVEVASSPPPVAPTSLPPQTGQGSAPSPDVSQGNRAKKEPRRNTRGRKKKVKAPEKVTVAATTGGGNLIKKKKEGPRAPSAASQDVAVEEAALSASEDPADLKRAELEETPATRIAFKDFYRAFRGEERHSFQKAEELAHKVLNDGSLPESIHWRVYLELADLARRSNRYIEARKLYQKVCQLQPFASQGWLEYSKLEEDCGFMNRVSNILHAGLEYCEYSETLLTRAVKHQEKMGNLASARGVLARLKHVGIDKVWRTVLEGALLEARAGNHGMARRVLKYLMHHVPWYGPLYLEAYKLERDQGHPTDALHIVERGLTTLPRYGPLWFGAFRLYEEMDVTEGQFHLPRTMLMIERAKGTISKELVWKLHLEAAQMLERTALAYVGESGLDLEMYLPPVRRRLVLTILTCPQNLRWKVWLAAGRMELVVGNVESAHLLFQRAHHCVQQKSKSATLLDSARLAEFRGDVELARGILTKARSFYGNDWKVWFESVLVEIRNDNHSRGYEIAARGLELHTGSGRLWATLVQLGQLVGGDEMQIAALERALSAVPKSGEVWCEGARIHLNPFSCTFDLHRSRRYLHFAARFTPQFGDSFIESIRLEVLSQWLYPIAKYIWKKTKGSFDEAPDRSLARYVADVCLAIAVARRNDLDHPARVPETKFRDIVSTLRKKLKADNLRSSIDLTDLRLTCTNADPNYGSLWFHCRRLPMFTPRRVIEHAAEDIADEIFRYANIYLAAMIRRMAVLATVDQEMPEGAEGTLETSDQAVMAWEKEVDEKLKDAASLQDILNAVDSATKLVLLESTIDGSIFITGLSELNRCRPLASMTLLERRRALFGTDALFP